MLKPAPNAPVAAPHDHVRDIHGTSVNDPWFWLRQRDNPDVIFYVEAENTYWEATMAPAALLQERLFQEFKSRIQETDMSVPVRKGNWWYLTRTVEGCNYPVHVRRSSRDDETSERVIVDENVLSDGHEYFEMGILDVSPDSNVAAYSADTDGSEMYTLRFRDLTTGDELADVIEGVVYGSAWSKDSQVFFYTRPDDVWRQFQVWRHVLGTPPDHDECVFQEDDQQFELSLDATRSGDFAIIHSGSRSTHEVHVVDLAKPLESPRCISERTAGVEYSVDHQQGRFLIATNLAAPNFRLMECPIADTRMDAWVEVLPHRADVKLQGVDCFETHFVAVERASGLPRLSVHFLDGSDRLIEFDDDVYDVSSDSNPEYGATTYRYRYSSMITPDTLFEEDVATGSRETLKRMPVLGDFDPATYQCRREWAVAHDGERVPIGVMWHKDTPLDGTAPCLLYGYGSYETIIPDQFSTFRLSLVDRGVVFAVGHPRGGGEMGRRWWDDGKLENKINTFTDFAACADHLAANRYCDPARVAIRGASAGGLLVGATMALHPGKFRAVVGEVPFVDVINTMLDATIPLTTGEWEEWGNPANEPDYHWMQRYNPYENVRKGPFPSIYLTAGLNDPRVQYWEPLKFIAKIRSLNTSEYPVILRTEMGAGHGGPSGRYDSWRDEARVFSFLLHELGIVD